MTNLHNTFTVVTLLSSSSLESNCYLFYSSISKIGSNKIKQKVLPTADNLTKNSLIISNLYSLSHKNQNTLWVWMIKHKLCYIMVCSWQAFLYLLYSDWPIWSWSIWYKKSNLWSKTKDPFPSQKSLNFTLATTVSSCTSVFL